MLEDAFGPAGELVGGLARWAHEVNMRAATMNGWGAAGTERPRQRLAYRRRKGQLPLNLGDSVAVDLRSALAILRRWDVDGLPPVRSFE